MCVDTCVDTSGKTTYQQAPCPTAEKQQAIAVRVAPSASASTAPGKSAHERIWATTKRDRRIQELEQSIADTEGAISSRSVRISAIADARFSLMADGVSA